MEDFSQLTLPPSSWLWFVCQVGITPVDTVQIAMNLFWCDFFFETGSCFVVPGRPWSVHPSASASQVLGLHAWLYLIILWLFESVPYAKLFEKKTNCYQCIIYEMCPPQEQKTLSNFITPEETEVFLHRNSGPRWLCYFKTQVTNNSTFPTVIPWCRKGVHPQFI